MPAYTRNYFYHRILIAVRPQEMEASVGQAVPDGMRVPSGSEFELAPDRFRRRPIRRGVDT